MATAPRVMRDSTTPADIPLAGLDLVAGYANGRFAWSSAGWARFGGRPLVKIDVNAMDPGACGVLDVESGDATPAEAPLWIKARQHLHPGIAGRSCTIYTNQATLPAVRAAMSSAGLAVGQDFTLWIATLDGVRATADHLAQEVGVVAVQWRGQAQTGGHYDESLVYAADWHPGTPPATPPPTWQAQALKDAQALVTLLAAHQ